MNKIEKCARLMGWEYEVVLGDVFVPETIPDLPDWRSFNPLTNKADLVDLMCAVGIDFQWHDYAVLAVCTIKGVCEWGYFDDHTDKQTALAHAVVDVACQIYDRRDG